MPENRERKKTATGGDHLLLDDRIGLDAMRALDALEEQLFGDPLDSITGAAAVGPKRRRFLYEEEEPF